MVIFSHRGIGFGERENSLAALSAAVKGGVSVEVDLRLNAGKITLSHEADRARGGEFEGLVELIKDSPDVIFAIHLKENSEDLFQRTLNSLSGFKNYFFFITDFRQDDFIRMTFSVVGKDHLALYVTEKDLDQDLVKRVGFFWLDETKANIYEELNYFTRFNKKIVCCSPEIFMANQQKHPERFIRFLENNKKNIFGICTDIGSFYEKKIKRTRTLSL